jgi:hypothetical protein
MKRILILIDRIFPAKSENALHACKSMIHCLSQQYKFFVVATDTGLPDQMKDQWIPQGDNFFLRHVPKKAVNATVIKQIIKKVNPHAIYFNSLFSLWSTLRPLTVLKEMRYEGKIIIAPRGTLPLNLIEYNFLKKKLFLYFLSRLVVRSNIIFHATSQQEAIEVKRKFTRNAQVLVVENPVNNDHSPDHKNKYEALFE